MIDQTYYLSMVPGGIPVRVPVSQYDAGAGRNIVFTLVGPNSQAFEVPGDADVTCDGTKKDKKAFSYPVTASGSTVTVPVEEQMTAVAGPVVCQITISSDGAVLGTANFVLDVERAALADDADMSETDIATLQTWLAEAIAARDAAAASETAAADSATAASDSAATAKALAGEASDSASAAAASALESATAAANAASEAAEATAAEINESIQTELDAKADQTDLDDAVENISTNTSNISSLQSSVSTNTSNISSLQSSVSELNSKLGSLIVIKSNTASETVTIAANSGYNTSLYLSYPDDPDGYKFLTGWARATGDSAVVSVAFGSSWLQNTSDQSATVTVSMCGIYIKSEFA